MWGSRVSDTAKRRERFERKLYARPKDRKTLLAFQNFLYEQGQYEYAKRVFAQSVAAGNDGRQMRLRMARTVLALYRIKLDEDEHHQSLAETRASQGYQHMGPEEARTTLRRAMEDLALVLE